MHGSRRRREAISASRASTRRAAGQTSRRPYTEGRRPDPGGSRHSLLAPGQDDPFDPPASVDADERKGDISIVLLAAVRTARSCGSAIDADRICMGSAPVPHSVAPVMVFGEIQGSKDRASSPLRERRGLSPATRRLQRRGDDVQNAASPRQRSERRLPPAANCVRAERRTGGEAIAQHATRGDPDRCKGAIRAAGTALTNPVRCTRRSSPLPEDRGLS
jgi:hypothetical protein